eukprot:gb/GECH01013819.1/.p1 GENE.gb/GECH01013819.1/~~gb/GECH01013819.1/.p1  ORF type:complete len:315 (+),score=62.67 gb/GECH01013819.1/:1-945(+)
MESRQRIAFSFNKFETNYPSILRGKMTQEKFQTLIDGVNNIYSPYHNKALLFRRYLFFGVVFSLIVGLGLVILLILLRAYILYFIIAPVALFIFFFILGLSYFMRKKTVNLQNEGIDQVKQYLQKQTEHHHFGNRGIHFQCLTLTAKNRRMLYPEIELTTTTSTTAPTTTSTTTETNPANQSFYPQHTALNSFNNSNNYDANTTWNQVPIHYPNQHQNQHQNQYHQSAPYSNLYPYHSHANNAHPSAPPIHMNYSNGNGNENRNENDGYELSSSPSVVPNPYTGPDMHGHPSNPNAEHQQQSQWGGDHYKSGYW